MSQLSHYSQVSGVPAALELRRVEHAAEGAAGKLAWSFLTPAEQLRAKRFVRAEDFNRFVKLRAALREKLGELLNLEPTQVPLTANAQGKPQLSAPAAETGWQFNVSHSGALGLLVFARGRAVGIDVEQHKAASDLLELAQRFFSPTEQAALLTLPHSQQTQAFYDAWTRKEACLKALGTGFSVALDGFSVSLSPDEPARLLSVSTPFGALGDWSLRAVPVSPGYSAAVVWQTR